MDAFPLALGVRSQIVEGEQSLLLAAVGVAPGEWHPASLGRPQECVVPNAEKLGGRPYGEKFQSGLLGGMRAALGVPYPLPSIVGDMGTRT